MPQERDASDQVASEAIDARADDSSVDVAVIAIAEADGSALIIRPDTEATVLAAADEAALEADEAIVDRADGEEAGGEAERNRKQPWRLTHPGSRAIATLLATAAILAALITTRASLLSGQGSDNWQTSLRDEVKRSAAVQEDVRYVYQNLVPVAMMIETARVQEVAMKEQLAAHPEAAARLNLEIAALEQVQQSLKDGSPLSSRQDLALPSGGWDLGATLADERNQTPDLVAIDPDADVAAGDAAAAQARRLTFATIPISAGVLFAALAEPFIRWRRGLVWLAALLVAVGAIAWALIELLT